MRISRQRLKYLLRQVTLPVLVWSVLVASLCVATLSWDSKVLVKQAEANAGYIYARDMLFRNWIASHGGVYVPVTEATPPNPQLDFLASRDVELPDGRMLTLMNPAYMSRQVYEVSNAELKVQTHLTSLNPLAPGNRPDAWEEAALRKFLKGEESVSEVVESEKGRSLRYMKPFVTQQSCLKCHARQGYAIGDVRGGFSVSLPLPSVFEVPVTTYKVAAFAGIWLIGLCGLGWWLGRENMLILSMNASEQRKLQIEANLRFAERYDRATHLPNRSYLLEVLDQIISSGDDPSPYAAVVIVEFPDLGRLQRAFSSTLATMLLRKAAERISSCLFSRDMVAGVGEQRLAIVLRVVERNNLQAIADKIAREFEVPLTYEDEEFQLVPIFGAACAPDEGKEAEILFSRALAGLESSRRHAHQQIGYAPNSNHLLQRRIQLEKDLRRAIRQRELLVYFQPQIDAVSGQIVGAEALVRWDHPKRGMISPAEFIPWIEEAGLMGRLGEHVLRESCLQFIRLRDAGWPELKLSLNLSARQFRDPKLTEQIHEVLEESGLRAENLELEITEGSFIEDFERTVMVMTELKSLGVRIAIDDFGTGFSSLSYLSKLPIDTLKIDRSFVSEMEQENDVSHIVDAIISLSDKLGFQVVAEGVEHASQVTLLTGKGCRVMQGYYFARPLDGHALEAFVASSARSTLQEDRGNYELASG